MKFQDQVIILSGIKNSFDDMYSVVVSMEFSPQEIEQLIFKPTSSKLENNFANPPNPDAKVFNKRNLSMLHSAIFEVN